MNIDMAKQLSIAALAGLVAGLAGCSDLPVGADASLTAAQRDQAQREASRPPVALDESCDTVIVERDLAVPLDQFSLWFARQGAAEFSVFMTGASASPPVRLVARSHNGAVRSDALIGSWTNVGDRRRVVFADGASALEEITSAQLPPRLQYEVWNLTDDTGRYISYALSEFRFTASGRGTHIRWAYSFRPRGWPDRWFIARYVHDDFRQFMETTLTAIQVKARVDSGME